MIEIEQLTRGTAATVFWRYRKPTRSAFPQKIYVPFDPTETKVQWAITGTALVTWTYPGTSPIVRLTTGDYVVSVPTSGIPIGTAGVINGTINGYVEGQLVITKQFILTVKRAEA